MRVDCSVLDKAIEVEEITIYGNTLVMRTKNTYYSVDTKEKRDINKAMFIEILNNNETINLKSLLGNYAIDSHSIHSVKYMITDDYMSTLVEGHISEENGEICGYYIVDGVSYDIIIKIKESVNFEDIKVIELNVTDCIVDIHMESKVINSKFEGLF